ncbi:acyl-homoserine-lactone synthase [Methylobacterium planeticum]|uniref:Acyl-homoserine-lactone synthase n=1 Tax=Methylobacterium planeticum TaxID=2615211 RepID=A0A6N6MTE9_9HYPH|nr:acyl-homoserine-lactone synthase [Methylobacterium planeticum]KAB1073713.1 GNAT family N-acetyltransferase [Methylobacterium planeticum]
MFKLLSGQCGKDDAGLMDKVYRFRHDFFVDHLKWEACRKPDGREIDEFDTPHCYHVVGLDGGTVVSYSRLLPTTRPHLQTHLYPEILQGAPSPSGPHIYEWTRCAVAPAKRESSRGVDAVSGPSFTAVAEAAALLGLEGLLVQTHPILVSRLMSFGWEVDPLALPCSYDGSSILPIYARLTPDTIETHRQIFRLSGSVLEVDRVRIPSRTPIDLPHRRSA